MPGRFRSNVDRQATYEIKTKPERVKETIEDQRANALLRHAVKQEQLASFEIQAKQEIGTTGVPTPLYTASVQGRRLREEVSLLRPCPFDFAQGRPCGCRVHRAKDKGQEQRGKWK